MEKPGALDWSLVQAFLAVADTGSLSGAARRLGASQPTLGRQIRAAEAQLGTTLFHRRARGLDLTEAGLALLEPARAMHRAAQEIGLRAAGQDQRLAGTVRITASVMTSVYHLPPIIARLREAEPDIEVELVPSDQSRNLTFREADIAVRMYRPTQLDLITRHIGDMTLGVFAAQSYVDRRGLPETPQDIARHDVVGFDQDPSIRQGFEAMGLPVTRGFFKTRCDDNIAYWHLVRAGCGLGFVQNVIARADPDMIEVPLDLDLPVLPVWLTAHEAMRSTARLRRVWDVLADGLKPLVS